MASTNKYKGYTTNLDLGQIPMCASARFLLLHYKTFACCYAYHIIHFTRDIHFYSLKLFPCETWLRGWIHF